LSLTDQAIAFGNHQLRATEVSAMLGTLHVGDIHRLVDVLIDGDGPGLLAEIARIGEFTPDYRVILEDLLNLFHRVALEQLVPGSADNAAGDAQHIRHLAGRLTAEDTQLFYQTALIGRRDLDITPDTRMGFEMTLLRMLAFRPAPLRATPPASVAAARETPATSVPASAADAEDPEPAGTTSSIKAPQPAAVSTDPAMPPAAAEPAPVPEPLGAPAVHVNVPDRVDRPVSDPDMPPIEAYAEWDAQGPADDDVDMMAPAPAPAPATASAATVPAPPVTEPPAVQVPPVALSADRFEWPRDFQHLGITGLQGSLAQNASWRWISPQEAELTFDEGTFRLLNERHRERILERVQAVLGAVRLRFQVGTPEHTPAAWAEAERQRRQREAEQAIHADQALQALMQRFGGMIEEGSIEPVL
ncbi:MAG: DNA polymerase III subunit gamma/tau, partial [Gammaproteobacteria bacterium]|nr:DNA polymerase III subunit gamma/tau [Gammaproteobacteria bacterium]